MRNFYLLNQRTDKSKIDISVCIITYNIENYILECLNSVISQVGDFKYEIVVNDDNSTDNTFVVLQKFVRLNAEYPIRVYQNKANLGLNLNYLQALARCNGHFIAMLDGDDFWISTNKLNYQLAFLKNHHEFGGIVTNSILVDGNSKQIGVINKEMRDRSFKMQDVAFWRPFQTSSLLFRRDLLSEVLNMKEIFANFHSIDKFLYFLIVNHSSLFYSSEILAAYRKIPTGNSLKYNTTIIDDEIKIVQRSTIFTLRNKNLILAGLFLRRQLSLDKPSFSTTIYFLIYSFKGRNYRVKSYRNAAKFYCKK